MFVKHKVKFITFFYLPRGTSENIFKVESLAPLKVGGTVRNWV